MPLKMGKEEKSAGNCERSLYLQKHSFYSFSSFGESAAFKNGGQSGFCRAKEVCAPGLLSTETFFPFDQYDSLKNLGVQSVQLHTMPCHEGQDPGWGMALFLASPAPGIS